MKSFDLAVLGGGPGGYVAAIRAAQLGLKTAIIDKDRLGGICLNWGCIPTKALLKNAEILNYVKNANKYGIKIDGYSVDFPKTISRSRAVSERLSKGVEFLMKKNKITHFQGYGILQSPTEIEIQNDKQKETIKSKKIIIATGGRPKTFPGMQFKGKQIIGSREAMILDKIPKKMVIIGGGAIGVEFAYFYNTYGSEIHLIEMLPNILPVEDKDISKELEKEFKKSGIRIYTESRVEKIETLKNEVKITISKNGKSISLAGDIALLAVGTTGNIEKIGLEKVGISTDKGSININEFSQTNVPNVYAIGDVTGPPWLAHVASAQGIVAAEHASGLRPDPVDLKMIPGCIYCQPQVASMGLTEAEALSQGFKVKIGKFDFRANGKALAIGEGKGFVKLIFDEKYGELLGCHMIGPEVTELIAELGVAKTLETTWEELGNTIHAHPTLSESIMEAALDAYDQALQH
jgi:dihydrolipoamide dehydrogenase